MCTAKGSLIVLLLAVAQHGSRIPAFAVLRGGAPRKTNVP